MTYTLRITHRDALDISDKLAWDAKIVHAHAGAIYQTFAWDQFMDTVITPGKTRLFELLKGDTRVASGLGYMYPLGRGKYWLYFSRGPLVFAEDRDEVLGEFFRQVSKIESKNCVWIRFDPALQGELKGFAPAHKNFHPKKTLMLDLTPSEDDVLAQMKSKGRYNIRLAKKKGVEVFGFTMKDGGFTQIIGGPIHVENPVSVYHAMTVET